MRREQEGVEEVEDMEIGFRSESGVMRREQEEVEGVEGVEVHGAVSPDFRSFPDGCPRIRPAIVADADDHQYRPLDSLHSLDSLLFPRNRP